MNMKRMRGRNHRPNGGGGAGGGGGFRNQQNGIPLNRNHVFDSSGPEMRLRGTAQQLHEKYTQLARDASSSGDRVLGEAYYQHAEHYFRIISAINQATGQPNGQPNQQGGQQNSNYQGGQQDRYQDRGQGYQGNNNNNNNQGGGDYNRRTEPAQGDVSTEPQTETRQEQPRQDTRQHDSRQDAPRPQQEQPRRFEQRPYEPRNRPEFPRPERTERPRPEAPVVDTRIDISSALEAELAAVAGEPAGFGEQPELNIAVAPPKRAEAIPEPRAIPISTTPPEEAAAPRVPRPRGRPRAVKADVAE